MSIKCHLQNNTFHKTVLTGFYLVVSAFAFSQAIVENNIEGENPYLDNPFTAGQVVDEKLLFSGIGRSDTIEGYEALDRYNAHLWNTEELDEERYFTLIITPRANCYIDFLSFEFSAQSSTTGPVAVALRSSIDDFTENIGIPAINGGFIDMTSEGFQGVDGPIEFRIYAWGATTEAGTFSVNDFVFNGYVFDKNCMVPAVPGLISGSDKAYPGESGVFYQIDPIDRADDYKWDINGDAMITEGAGTDGVVVTVGENDFSISVSGTNECGTGPMSSEFYVNVEYPVLYFHDFGESEIADHPYEEMPVEMDENLGSSSWTNTNKEWLVYAGVNGNPSKAISANNLMGNPEFVLSLDVSEGYRMMISGFNFWRRSSGTGPTEWSLTTNSINMGNGLSSYGSYIGRTTVLNPVSGLTGNVTIQMNLSGATSSSGTFRIDDFTLYGLVDCVPIDVDAPEDVEVCGAYELPTLNIGNYFTGSGGTGEELIAGDIVTTSQIIYVYAECDAAPECNNENSFEVIVHELITTNPIMRVD
ncbi:MAG: hypothetical protein K9G70_10840 [Prolixibacteraceae bacterium]|nr:hypothetical protein [Prolixibacteraceae bacterium]